MAMGGSPAPIYEHTGFKCGFNSLRVKESVMRRIAILLCIVSFAGCEKQPEPARPVVAPPVTAREEMRRDVNRPAETPKPEVGGGAAAEAQSQRPAPEREADGLAAK